MKLCVLVVSLIFFIGQREAWPHSCLVGVVGLLRWPLRDHQKPRFGRSVQYFNWQLESSRVHFMTGGPARGHPVLASALCVPSNLKTLARRYGYEGLGGLYRRRSVLTR